MFAVVHRRPRALAVLTAVAVAVTGLAAAPSASAGTATAHYAVNRPLCDAPGTTLFRCFAMAAEPATADTPGAYRVATVGHGKAGGYSPADLAKAYGYDPDAHVSQTVAIVDWYDDPNVAADLATFDRTYGLPAETSRSFRKVNQDGRPAPLPNRSRDSATEIALDVQAVRAVCHRCRIVLVEADGPTTRDLARAENTAVRLGADEISNSFGGAESAVSTAMAPAFRHPGVVITASTGDEGWLGWDYSNYSPEIPTDGEPSYPSSDPHVVAVGGTSLRVNADGTRRSETVWNGNGADNSVGLTQGAQGASGGGCSRYFTAPPWQWRVPQYADTRCGSSGRNRVVADVSAVADPSTGFGVLDTYGRGGWLRVGGTSLSAPVVAAMYALAGGSGGSAYPAASLYVNSARNAAARYDVVQGGNSYCGGETDLQRCMDAVAADGRASTNNPNGLTGERLDCSFPATGATVSTPPAPGRQCNALPGYDGPSGLGAPIGLGLFRPTSGLGRLLTPRTLRLGTSGTWTAALHERLAGATFTGFTWSWGDGSRTSGTTARAAHTFRHPGRYVVTVTAADSLHQLVTRSRVVRVGVAPSARYSGPKHLAAGHRGIFSAAGSRAVNTGAHLRSVTWRWGDGHRTGPSTKRRASHRFAHAGHYRVTLIVRDSTGAVRTVRHRVTVG